MADDAKMSALFGSDEEDEEDDRPHVARQAETGRPDGPRADAAVAAAHSREVEEQERLEDSDVDEPVRGATPPAGRATTASSDDEDVGPRAASEDRWEQGWQAYSMGLKKVRRLYRTQGRVQRSVYPLCSL